MGIKHSKMNKSNYNPSDYVPDSYSTCHGLNNRILLYAFMRDMEDSLDGASAMRIIPDTIIHLCDMYYSTQNIIFYFGVESRTQDNLLSIVDLDDMDRQLKKKHIFQYPLQEASHHYIQCAGMCHQSEIKLPKHIRNKVPLQFHSNTEYVDILFKCGGWNGIKSSVGNINTSCWAYIWKSEDKYFEHICPLQLPAFPKNNCYGQSIVWSGKQQCLYSITRYHLHRFSLHDWKWETPNDQQLLTPFAVRPRRGFMSSVIVTNDLNQERLISVGGGAIESDSNGVKYCDLYDIEKDEWMTIADLNYGRHRAGVYHDKWSQRLFIGGGNGAERKIEYYDLNKNKWYFDKCNIPLTRRKHNIYPLIWNQDGHLLYIASIKANGVEFVDLRQENRRWNVVYDKLDPLFDTNIVWYNAANCRLIQ
eukprot:232293_1